MIAAEHLAEQAGHAETSSLLEMMKSENTQAGRLTIFHACLVELAQSEYSEQALAGFAVAVLPWLERGLDIN